MKGKGLKRGHLPGSTIKPQVKLPKDPNDCWQFLGSIDATTGYGKKQWHGRTFLAHRWLWMQLFGPIPDNLNLRNTCGNLGCISPHHWALATMSECSANGVNSVLTAGDVVEIKRIPKKDRETRAQRVALAGFFSRKFGCSKQLIYDIWAGRAWKRASKKVPRRDTLPHPEESDQ